MEYSEEKLNFIRRREEADSGLTYRTLEEYCTGLGLTEDELRNKKILDVGQGRSDEFAKRVEQLGGKVFSISPALVRQWERRVVKRLPTQGTTSVAARAQNIPFRENSFDLVVSYFGVPAYLPTTDESGDYDRELYEHEIRVSVDEMLRVLKPDGEIRLTPVGIRLRGDPGDEGLIIDALGQKTKDELTGQGLLLFILRIKDVLPILVIRKPKNELEKGD